MNRIWRGLLALVVLLGLGLVAPSAQAAPHPSIVAQTDMSLGDSWNEGVGDRDPTNGYGWSPQVARRLNHGLERDGKGGSGYINPTTYGKNLFSTRLGQHPADAYANIYIQGSTNDKKYISVNDNGVWDTAAYAGKVNETMRYAKVRYPSAQIFIVGPVSISGTNDAYVLKLRDVLKKYSGINNLTFIDGIAAGWFVPGDWSRYSDAETGHPNDAAYQYIGNKIADAILASTANKITAGVSLQSSAKRASDYWLTNSSSNSSSFDCYAYLGGEWKKINDGKTRKGMKANTLFKCDSDWYARTINGTLLTATLKKNKSYKWSSNALKKLDYTRWAVAFKK